MDMEIALGDAPQCGKIGPLKCGDECCGVLLLVLYRSFGNKKAAPKDREAASIVTMFLRTSTAGLSVLPSGKTYYR